MHTDDQQRQDQERDRRAQDQREQQELRRKEKEAQLLNEQQELEEKERLERQAARKLKEAKPSKESKAVKAPSPTAAPRAEPVLKNPSLAANPAPVTGQKPVEAAEDSKSTTANASALADAVDSADSLDSLEAQDAVAPVEKSKRNGSKRLSLKLWLLLCAAVVGACLFFIRGERLQWLSGSIHKVQESLPTVFEEALNRLPGLGSDDVVPVATDTTPRPADSGPATAISDVLSLGESVVETEQVKPEPTPESVPELVSLPAIEANPLTAQVETLQQQLEAVRDKLRLQQQWNAQLEQGLQNAGLLQPGDAMHPERFIRPTITQAAAVPTAPAAAAQNATPRQEVQDKPRSKAQRSVSVRSSSLSKPTAGVAPKHKAPQKDPEPQVQLLSVDMWDGRPSVVLSTTDASLGTRVMSPGDVSNGIALTHANPRTQQATFLVGGKPLTLNKGQ